MGEWPKGVQPLFLEDQAKCIEEMHAGKCPYREVQDVPHAYMICTKIIQLVWCYGGDTKQIPKCMPLKANIANQILSLARKRLNLTSVQLPEPFTKQTSLYHSVINRILFRNIIEPMQKRGRGPVR